MARLVSPFSNSHPGTVVLYRDRSVHLVGVEGGWNILANLFFRVSGGSLSLGNQVDSRPKGEVNGIFSD